MIKTPLRYRGSKTRALKLITRHVPFGTKRIVSPFLGGGSLEVHWAANLGIETLGFDVFEPLVNWWQVQLSQPEALYETMRHFEPTVEGFDAVKQKLKAWRAVQDIFAQAKKKTDYYIHPNPVEYPPVEAAAYFYFLHTTSFGPTFYGHPSTGPKAWLSEHNWLPMLHRARRFRAPKLHVALGSFEQVIGEHSNDFLYLDPPYYLSDEPDNEMTQAIYPSSDCPTHHEGFDHAKLRDLLHNHKGSFILSYNNCATLRGWYKDFVSEDFRMIEPQWAYSLNQTKDEAPKKSHELLVMKLDNQPAFWE